MTGGRAQAAPECADVTGRAPVEGRRRQAVNDPICPVCDSDVPLNSDAQSGEELFCPYCGSVLRLKLKEDDWEVEEEY